MDLKSIYYLKDGEPGTFDNDENLPALPLPSLNDTLERYYRSLIPFGTTEELQNSRKIIDTFKNGIGFKLHEMLKKKAEVDKNWVR